MQRSAILISKYDELGLLLRRRFWQPLHRTMQIFHVLPLTAAVLIFFLLATNGQLREIYLSYLEDLSDLGRGGIATTAAACAAGMAGLALLSTLLYVAHYGLSTMRINVVYSSYSNPDIGSRTHTLQRLAAIGLALFPWLGLVAGLFGTRSYLMATYALLKHANISDSELASILHLPAPSGWVIPASTLLQGVATAFFLDLFRHNRFVQWAGIIITPLAAAILFLLLTNSSPTAESKTSLQVLVAVGLIVVGYCAVHVFLYRMRSKFIYSRALRPDAGINLRQRRRILLFAWALFPWLAIASYFAIPLHFEKDIVPGSSSWVMIPLAMTWTIAIGLTVAMLLDRFRENAALVLSFILTVVVLISAAQLASSLGIDTIVSAYRWVGPLGSIAVELLLVLSLLTLLAWLSQKSGFPALTLVILAIVVSAIFPIPVEVTFIVLTSVCALLVVAAFLSHLYEVAAVAALLAFAGYINVEQESVSVPAHPYSHTDAAIDQRFENWLDQPGRTKANVAAANCAQTGAPAAPSPGSGAASSGKYPVFIIAAEGGGIYAASAASLFLAKIEDACPDFSQHVFAISGVSGGAIGATIFDALDRSFSTPGPAAGAPTPSVQPQGTGDKVATAGSVQRDSCADDSVADAPGDHPTLCREVAKILQDDHLSPVVASIFPEFFGATTRRDKTLAGSFEASVRSVDPAAAKVLEKPFVEHWTESSPAPALVLNTTWVETGFRVAFAPFPLHSGGDESLYSFSDVDMPGENDTSLIDAAVDSARFPGMLPSYSVKMEETATKKLLWNFVDGGYSDNSGALTALALYQALKPIEQKRNIDIKIILVTSAIAQLDLSPASVQIEGTAFRDTLAPIDAIMNVREGLGNDAVARTCSVFYSSKDCKDDAANQDAKLQIVEIDDQTYGLSLGWKISKMSFDVISWMLGEPGLCDETTASRGSQRTTRLNNSCVQQHIEALLDRNPSTGP